jgi:hypothetical protein
MYDIEQDKWVSLPSMPETVTEMTCVSGGDAVYVLGGRNSLNVVASVSHLDLGAMKWLTDPPMLHALRWPAAAAAGNDIYVLYNTDYNKTISPIPLQRYSTAAGEWSFGSALPQSVRNTGGASLCAVGDGDLYALGGPASLCLHYKVQSDTWTILAQPSLEDHCYAAVLPHNGKIYLCGGAYNGCTADIEEYDIDQNQWQVSPLKLPASICHHTAAMLTVGERM